MTNTIQRFHQQCHQVAVGKQQDQQTDNRGNDDHRAGHAGQPIHHHARGVEPVACGLVKAFGCGTKGAAQRRGDVVRLLAIALQRTLLRLLHLRRYALIEQRLPGADHLGGDLLIHRAWRNGLHLFQFFGHVIQRLLR